MASVTHFAIISAEEHKRWMKNADPSPPARCGEPDEYRVWTNKESAVTCEACKALAPKEWFIAPDDEDKCYRRAIAGSDRGRIATFQEAEQAVAAVIKHLGQALLDRVAEAKL